MCDCNVLLREYGLSAATCDGPTAGGRHPATIDQRQSHFSAEGARATRCPAGAWLELAHAIYANLNGHLREQLAGTSNGADGMVVSGTMGDV